MTVRKTYARERGFTLIEVLIAVILLAIVAGGATMAIAGSTHGTSQVKIGDRQKSIASGVLNRLLANRAWIKTYNCGLGACDISSAIKQDDTLLAEPDGTIKHTVRVVATGLDLPSDTDASGKDADRQVPDVYRIDVTVTTDAPSEVVALKPWSVSGTLDMSVRSTTGTLLLRSCEVSVQPDERSSTGLCTSGARTLPILPPGGTSTYCPTSVTIENATPECAAWRQAVAAAVPGVAAVTTMSVAPVSVSFTLEGPMAGGTKKTVSVTTDSNGLAEVANLEPGRYELTPAASSSSVLWASHSVPSGGDVTIQAGGINEAVQVFRPAGRDVTIDLDHFDITDPADEVVRDGAWDPHAIKLVPVPNGRAALANGEDRGWTKIVRGMKSVTLKAVTPGLYQMSVLEYPGTSKELFVNEGAFAGARYIWVPPVSGTAPVTTQYPTTLKIRDVRCDSDTRNALMAARITPTQIALGLAGRGFLWDKPDTEEIEHIWHGPCTGQNIDPSTEQTTGEAGA